MGFANPARRVTTPNLKQISPSSAFALKMLAKSAECGSLQMAFYFAYGSNLNNKAVADWCRAHGFRAPNLKTGTPSVIDNYRLCFPFYSEYWGGGVADIAYDPGKYVSGVYFDVPESDLKALDEKVGRKVDAAGREIGVYKRLDVTISPLKGKPVQGFTYQGVRVEKYHIPPTKHYMRLLLEGVFAHGMSMMWASYLQSFSVQEGRLPRVPGAT